MKKKVVLGILFLLGGFVTFLLYGMHYGQATLLIIGVLFLLPFKASAKQAEGTPLPECEENKTTHANPAFYRDVKSNSFPVAGVTFSNENGNLRSRQTILRRILFNDPPFDCEHTVTLEKYFYEGEPAYYVKVNGYIIGNVPKEFIPYVDFNSDRPYKIENFQVYGGGKGKKFGASLKMVFLDTLEE